LTSASCTSWSHTYSYDKAGNRTSKDSVTYTVNTVNEVTALSDGTSFTYDNNGNRTQKTKGTDTWVYTYDYANRLTEVEENSATIGEYVYDGNGKRIQVTENGETTTYIYFSLEVLYEENMTGIATYIYGPNGILGKRTTINEESNTFYYHTDHLGSTRLVTDSDKNIVSAVTYHPFGNPSIKEGSETYLFNGKEKDSINMYYYGARYYDPTLGRFITRDPLNGMTANSQLLNRYSYCLNNPVNSLDPTGLVVVTMSNDETGVDITITGEGMFIGWDCDGIHYTLAISSDMLTWELSWFEDGIEKTMTIMKDGEINTMEGIAFWLGFCEPSAFISGKGSLNGLSPEEYARKKLNIDTKEEIELFARWYNVGKQLGQILAHQDNELYRFYCPAPFDDDIWQKMVDDIAVELVFSYPWNPYPINGIGDLCWEAIAYYIKKLLKGN
jgi:RHS repeat-associated protein